MGWHDPIGSCSNRTLATAKYGEARYQEHRNEYHKNGRDSFLVELGKWGLGPRDLTANVNFFSRVDVAEDGAMTYHPANSTPGSCVELRAEMNTLAILNTCQHPLDPHPQYAPKPVLLSIRRAAPPAAPIWSPPTRFPSRDRQEIEDLDASLGQVPGPPRSATESGRRVPGVRRMPSP